MAISIRMINLALLENTSRGILVQTVTARAIGRHSLVSPLLNIIVSRSRSERRGTSLLVERRLEASSSGGDGAFSSAGLEFALVALVGGNVSFLETALLAQVGFGLVLLVAVEEAEETVRLLLGVLVLLGGLLSFLLGSVGFLSSFP
jgi:hypothetical protein